MKNGTTLPARPHQLKLDRMFHFLAEKSGDGCRTIDASAAVKQPWGRKAADGLESLLHLLLSRSLIVSARDTHNIETSRLVVAKETIRMKPYATSHVVTVELRYLK